MYKRTISQGVRADLLPELVNDLSHGEINIKHLGVEGMELLEHLLPRLYLPEEQTE